MRWVGIASNIMSVHIWKKYPWPGLGFKMFWYRLEIQLYGQFWCQSDSQKPAKGPSFQSPEGVIPYSTDSFSTLPSLVEMLQKSLYLPKPGRQMQCYLMNRLLFWGNHKCIWGEDSKTSWDWRNFRQEYVYNKENNSSGKRSSC